MSDKMKIREGKDGYSYPYTSPDLVVDENGKSATKKFDDISSQFKDIVKKIESGNVNLSKYATKTDLQNVVLEKVVADNADVTNILNLWKNKKAKKLFAIIGQ